ncbi:MAG: membrane protein insertion efficiency factor YidD [Polyangiaceae bacterium]|nr:membrane protein insertion efficiency factor YidD [Polyangiaceae bacterium]
MVRVLVALLRFYKLYVSPLLGNRCRFYPSCSTYMHDCLIEHGALRGLPLGGKRLLRCHPFHPGGVDLPPKRLGSQKGFINMEIHHHG